jgi:hypothetical protein
MGNESNLYFRSLSSRVPVTIEREYELNQGAQKSPAGSQPYSAIMLANRNF